MADYSSFNYSLPIYYGTEVAQDYLQNTPTYDQQRIAPQDSRVMSVSQQPHNSKDYQNFFYSQNSLGFPAAPISSQTSFEGQCDFNSGLLPTSANPVTSISPWAYQASTQQPSEYLTHSPAWPVDVSSYDYCPCEQHVPMQMPELGYESSSPASDGVTYSRMTVSESPLPKMEHDDDFNPPHQVAGHEEDSDNADPCYAELLRACLLEAPDYTMSLRDLYAWVSEHSPKAKDPNSTGWKNSVRHNLSMNQVCIIMNTSLIRAIHTNLHQGFEKVLDKSPSSSGNKHRSFWRLTEDAATRGIQSTTRYRKGDGKRKSQRADRHGTPDDKRVRSGAKGGQATRRLANRRAAAAARSTWGTPRHQRIYRDETYLNRNRSSAPTASPQPPPQQLSSYPVSTTSQPYWDGMAHMQDSLPYGATQQPYKSEHHHMQDFYSSGGTDYFGQPLDCSKTGSPVGGAAVKSESGWPGDSQEIGLGITF